MIWGANDGDYAAVVLIAAVVQQLLSEHAERLARKRANGDGRRDGQRD